MLLNKYQTKSVVAKTQIGAERTVTSCIREERDGGATVRVTMRGPSGSVVVTMIEPYRTPRTLTYAIDSFDGAGNPIDGGSSCLDELFDNGRRAPHALFLSMKMLSTYREDVLGICE
jgi:hypothetical protein